MERVHRDLLVLQPITGHLASLAEEDEVVGAIPGFDDVQPLANFAAQRRLAKIVAEEDGLGRLAELGQQALRPGSAASYAKAVPLPSSVSSASRGSRVPASRQSATRCRTASS